MTKKITAKKTTKDKTLLPAIGEEKVVMLTQKGYDEIINELEYLKNVKRREVADRIREAISYGDLSENSEYEESKNEQAFVEGRIMELEEKLKYAKIIHDVQQQKRGASVQLGSTVWIRHAHEKSANEQKFVIVGSTEADPVQSKISNVSPVGKALLDHEVGEVVQVFAPAGLIEYEILRIQ